jgi:hypothetical protein
LAKPRLSETEYEAMRARLEARGVRQTATVHQLPQPQRIDPRGKGRKAGWRTVAGRRIWFRSAWEANLSRYFQWLKERGEIREWEFEPETFWFAGVKRGVVSYLPDFRVTERDGSFRFIEVKGHMDGRSKTKLKRMAKYHPTVRVDMIGEVQYRAIAATMSKVLPGWE